MKDVQRLVNKKLAALILYFPEVLRKPTVILSTAAFSVEVLTQELLNTKQDYQKVESNLRYPLRHVFCPQLGVLELYTI
jgi:hypothetical protein